MLDGKRTPATRRSDNRLLVHRRLPPRRPGYGRAAFHCIVRSTRIAPSHVKIQHWFRPAALHAPLPQRVICNVLSARQPCPLLTRKRPNCRITAIHVDCVVEIGSADKIRRPELAYQFRSPVSCDDRLELSGLARCSGPIRAGLGGAPVLISIVLVVFMALAGFLIVRCSTPLSK